MLGKDIRNAYDTLLAWDSLQEGSSRNPEKNVCGTHNLEDAEKKISSWAPIFDWNPFSYIRQPAQAQQELKSQLPKPDPPPVLYKNLSHPQKTKPSIQETRYIHGIKEDSSIVSNWGPPSLLKMGKSRDRRSRNEKASESYNPPIDYVYDQTSAATKDETTQLHYHEALPKASATQSQHQTYYQEGRRNSDSSSSNKRKSAEHFKGFDPSLLLASWGLPVLEKVQKENQMRSLHVESMPKNAPITSRTVEEDSSSWGISGLERSVPQDTPSLMGAGRMKNSRDEIRDNSTSSSESIPIGSSRSSRSNESDAFDAMERGFSDPNVDPNPDASENHSSNGGVIDVPLERQQQNREDFDSPKLDSDSFNDEPIAPKRKRTRLIVWSVILGLLLLALIGGGVAAVLILLNKDNKDEPTVPPVSDPPIMAPSSTIPLPTQPPPPTVSTQSPMYAPTNAIPTAAIKDLIVANAPDDGVSLNDPTSPQSKALLWLQQPININAGYNNSRLLQRYALATIYYATNENDNSWTSSTGWLSEQDECTWFSTSESSDTVCTAAAATSTLDLPTDSANNNDNASGNDEGSSVYLELDLRGNGLIGTIPEEISLLSSLQIIRLSKNTLVGTIPVTITTALIQLQYLDLSSNKLVQGDMVDLLSDLQIKANGRDNIFAQSSSTNTDANTRIIANNNNNNNDDQDGDANNGDNNSGRFLSYLDNMQALTHLDLFDNSFKTTLPTNVWGNEDETGSPSLSSSPLSRNLKVLNLGSNEFFGTLPSEIGLLAQLTGLSVFDNSFSGTLPESISNLRYLELLYVDSNNFSSIRNVPGVPQEICTLLRPTPLKEFWSDCEEIDCTCCTTCCTKEAGCVAV